ncbi:hypothetical protein JG688_00010255, partial [Phytophthora aleatoria]
IESLDSGHVEVNQSPGHFISVSIGVRFGTRQEATLQMKNFALVQGKHTQSCLEE